MGNIDNYYTNYDPNRVLPIIAAILAGISLIGQCIRKLVSRHCIIISIVANAVFCSHYRFWRVTFFMLYAGIFYTVGWTLRCISIRHPGSLGLFISQNVFIYLAPPLFSAAEYNTLGRLMHYLPMHAVMNPNGVKYAFIFLGTIVEVLTATGAARMAGGQGADKKDMIKSGAMCTSIAVILQGLVELLFVAMVATVHYRCVKTKMLARNVRTIIIMLYGTSILILIRCIFRAVEAVQLQMLLMNDKSSDGALLKHEWPLYALETLPVLLYTYWLNTMHPGRFLDRDPRRYLDYDGETERMGPGWENKRHWIMYLADPFDFIGTCTSRKRDKFYLKPEFWPKMEMTFAQGTASNVRGKEDQTVKG